MKSQKLKSFSFCVGGRHHSSTTNVVCDETNKKNGEDNKLLTGQFSICNRRNYMTTSVNIKSAKGLGYCCKNLGKKGLDLFKKDGSKDFN